MRITRLSVDPLIRLGDHLRNVLDPRCAMPKLFRVLFLLIPLALAACAAPPVATDAVSTRSEIAQLTHAIRALGPDVDPAEAARSAEIAITYPMQLRRQYGVTDPPLVHNTKVNMGLRPRGLCWHWAEDMERRLKSGGQAIADDLGLGIEFEKVGGFDPVEFDEGCVTAVRNAAERLGYSHRDLISGAGHDACWINRVAPTAMVMCPCVDGLSHNEAEEISKDWAEKGTNVLFHAVVETAEVQS